MEDVNLETYLRNHSIKYIEHSHPAFFTVKEAEAFEKDFTYTRTKNLFLTDKKGNFFMYCLPAHKRAPLATLRKLLKLKDLGFGSEEKLKEKLGLKPGSVTAFALIRNPEVKLLLDKELWQAETIGFHPNINTATLELTQKDFHKYYNSLPNAKEVVELA